MRGGHVFPLIYTPTSRLLSAWVMVLTREGERVTTKQLELLNILPLHLPMLSPAEQTGSHLGTYHGEHYGPKVHRSEISAASEMDSLCEWPEKAPVPTGSWKVSHQAWFCWPQCHFLVTASLPCLQSSPRVLAPGQPSMNIYSNVFQWFDLIWFGLPKSGVLSLGLGSFISLLCPC